MSIKTSWHFKIPGEPVGKGRPRATTINGQARMYTPAKTASYEARVIDAFMRQGIQPIAGSVGISIAATFSMPISWSMKKRKAMDGKHCCKKPDADNILKVVGDALNGVAYRDDAAIVSAHVTKRWGQDGGVLVILDAIEE
jgi:Holliday junction resolvase RusA-like endonuclease